MSTERAELPGEETERGWRDRFGEVSAAARALLRTRLAIFREELGVKAVLAARGMAFVVGAAAFGVGALLLGAALLAALFAKLFGSVILGILAAAVLYGAAAAGAAWAGVKALMRVRPLEFPATSSELARDFDAAAAALAPERCLDEDVAGSETESPTVDDLEERFRAGSE